ncbi:MAG TPA: prepilin peptidase [Acidimicrobiales bacterium]|nr:prepilin peptidase [Acidimicrobiales bacterium]
MLIAPGAVPALMLGLVGLVIGSFANVVIYRVPAGRSIVSPGSACPKCGAEVRPFDNLPVVSWFVLRGRCRDCRAAISPRYPAIEALTGLVFAGLGWRFGISWTGAGEAVLAAGLVILGFIDLDHMLLPRRIVYLTLTLVGVAFVIGAASGSQWHRLGVAAICAVVPWALFFAINFISPKALGFGDVRLALLIGFGLGWLGAGYAFLGFVIASVLGSVVGVTLMALGKAGRRTPIPFGTFLAAGALIAALAGSPIVNWYTTQIHH